MDPEDDQITARMIEWIRAWECDPEHTGRALPKGRVPRKEDPVFRFGARVDGASGNCGGPLGDGCELLLRILAQRRAEAGGEDDPENDYKAAAHGGGGQHPTMGPVLKPGRKPTALDKDQHAFPEVEQGQAQRRRRRVVKARIRTPAAQIVLNAQQELADQERALHDGVKE